MRLGYGSDISHVLLTPELPPLVPHFISERDLSPDCGGVHVTGNGGSKYGVSGRSSTDGGRNLSSH